MTLEQMKTIKKNFGISAREISGNTGIPFGTVQKIFTGETANPRFNTLVKLNEFFAEFSLKYLSEMPAEELDYFELTLGKRQGEFTVSDRDALPDDIRTELIDGYIYFLASPNRKHQTIAGMIYAELLAYAFSNDHRCLPQIAPVDVNLDNDDKTMLQPDVLVLCHEDRDDRYVHGAPEFVAEILSKSSRRTDTTLKLNKYMNAGVREYWIVDPYTETVTVYDFTGDVYPLHYTFEDAVPVSISGGECVIDFGRIRNVLIRQFG